MPYLCKLTAKQTVGGKLPKGATIQVVSNNYTPIPKDIHEAIKLQLGIDLQVSSCQSGYFTIERMK